LFSSCTTQDEQCKYCYTGTANCYEQTKPFGTLLLGGTSNLVDKIAAVEIFAEGRGPYSNVMHVSEIVDSY
jgi:hypothetical protein